MATSPTPPSSSLPQPLSYDQILGQMLSSYASALGVNDLNVGSANTSFFAVVALMVARSSGDIFQILRDFSLSRATGPALQNLAIEYGVPPLGATVATGFVTVTDLSFQEIFTTIYAGVNPPITGSTTIYVSNASNFPATGAVYIGRGSVNVEGPISYSSITSIGSYYAINLSSPTTKYHNLGESVILSQGGVRTVPSNTIVVSPGIGTTPDIQYTVTQTGTILDGETTVTNIPIAATTPGASANVPAGAISEFSGNPSGLSNASVTNPLAITTGQNTETDDQLRVRVTNALASTGLGTVQAIESALQGVQSPTSSDTIVSTDVLNSSGNTIVYIDNGSILEATQTGVPIEAIVNSALGGEEFFQLVTGGTQTSVTKTLLQSVAVEPFNLSGGEHLTVVVGNITYDHVFSSTDFANPGSATAYEVCASINGDTLLNFEAVTAGGGTYVVIRPEDEVTNRIQVTTPASSSDINANIYLQFPSQLAETLRLYKNGILLTEDGSTASIFTQPQSLWSSTIANGDTLIISVDGTAPITYTITNAQFIAEGTYTSVSYANSLQSWVNVLNNLITGITASIVGSTIEITSNLGPIDRAQVVISNSSTLVSKGFFSSTDLSSTGIVSDYILDRNTAQIQLTDALVIGDSLSAGTLLTQANIQANEVVSGSVTLSSDAHVWIAIDTPATIIPTIQNGSLLSVSQVSPNIVRYTSNSSSAFSNVLPGDYVIVWSAEIPTSDQLEGRVHAITATTLDIEVTVAEYSAVTPVSNAAFIQGFVVVRTSNVPQKFTVSSGTDTLQVIAADLQAQTDELTFGVFNNTNITVATNTDDTSGEITIVTADASGALLGFVSGSTSLSQESLIANYETQATTSELPLFFHSTISADSYADPTYSYLTEFTSALIPTTPLSTSFDPNEMIQFLNPYGVVPGTLLDDEQPALENVQMSALSGDDITILPVYPDVRRLRVNDRYFIASPLDFGYNDTVVAIVDNNTIGETYTMPLFRAAQVNSTYATNSYSFNAYDTAAGPTASFATNFNVPTLNSNFTTPTDFFANYKVLMQPKFVVSGSNPNTSLLYRSAIWGSSGEAINISYVYPTSANQSIGSIVTANDSINIEISLISGAAIATNIAANTQWNVTIASNTPVAGVDQVTYTYAGTYTFTVTSANATMGAVYEDLVSGQSFVVNATITSQTTLVANGLGTAPSSSGTLTKISGAGDVTITYSAFSFQGIGPAPALPTSVGNGAYVTISTNTGFNLADTGTFLISTATGYTPTANSFSVQVPTGTAVAQPNAVTTVATGMQFYIATPTSASAINTYVNANLSQYVTSTIVNGDGSGIIVEGTYEDSNFTIPNYYLKDGVNWIQSSNVVGSPQFTLKEPLAYPSGSGYAFNGGDTVLLVPTTMDQVSDFWNVLAVTGFTTVGSIETSDRGTKLQLSTNTVGSGGSIQVVGGSGNEYVVPVLTSGELIDLTHMVVSANSIAAQAVASNQWFRLQAENYQNKDTGIAANTSVTVLSNTPIAGESTVTLLNQESGQLYFGSPRSGINIEGNTFRIEKQGNLACLSWNGSGTNPDFVSSVNINDFGNWTVDVSVGGIYTSVPAVSPPSPPPSPLGTAATYAILASSAITNTGASVITGNVGVSPAGAITPGGWTVSGTTDVNDGASATALADANSVFTSMQTQGLEGAVIPSALDGQTLTPGAYQFASGAATLATSANGTLTFNGAGTYIIYTASTLTTGAGGIPTMILENGASANDIYWVVGSSATINSGSAGTFEGNIVAQASITDTLGGTVNGSMIALTAAVTLSAATIASVATSPSPPAPPASNANFSALSVGDIITISGLENASNNGTFMVTAISPNGLSFTVNNESSVVETGTTVLAGDFIATSSVSEGDTMILSAPFAPLNQGTYRVIRMNDNSVWYENPDVVEEEVTCTANVISTGYDSTTVFNVTVNGGIQTIVWNGTGTEPFLGVALPGDIVTFGSGFSETEYAFTVSSANATVGATYTNNDQTFTVSDTITAGTTLTTTGTGNPTAFGTLTKTSGTGDTTITFSAFSDVPANQGSFIVSESGPSQQQIVQLSMPAGSTFSASGVANYFEIYNGGNANSYYVWYNVSGGSNTDPAPGGFTGIEVTINASDSAATVANETYTALSALAEMTRTISGNAITVTATVAAQTNIPVDVSMPVAFSFVVAQLGQMPFLSVVNPSAAAQSGISSVTFSINRPQIQFFPYDSTVPGDSLVVNGTVLGAGNAGTYTVVQVLNPTTAIVTGTISTQYSTNLAANYVSLSIQEGTAYTGYKQVSYVAPQPGTVNYSNIVFNTIAQYSKINLSAGVGLTSLNKLNFPTTIVNGTDAYNYDTGLIGQANRVVYGDPRDALTYPGVNAAGTSIFIREPLLKSISIALSIRTNIGVSFAQITSQIQSAVYALINSNPIGQSIYLSSIVETVAEIPGIISVVLTNPAYTVSNDFIQLVTGEKAFIPSQVNNISVSLIGS